MQNMTEILNNAYKGPQTAEDANSFSLRVCKLASV